MLRFLLPIFCVTLAAPTAKTAEVHFRARGLRKNEPEIIGVIEKVAAKPARFHCNDKEDRRLADFDQVIFLEKIGPGSLKERFPRHIPIVQQYPFQVAWDRGEHIAATLQKIGTDEVDLLTPFGARKLQRRQLYAFSPNPNGEAIWRTTFEELPNDWELRGSPTLSRERCLSPPNALLLSGAGQYLIRNLAPPLATGRFICHFFDTGSMSPENRWGVTLRFGSVVGKEDRSLPITIEGGWQPAHYAVRLPESDKRPSVGIPRSTGWHRLEVRFGPDQLLISLDDAALVSSFNKGAPGALAQIEIGMLPTDSPSKTPPVNHPIWIDDLTLLEHNDAALDTPLSLAELDQTRLIDAKGDLWVGELLGGDSQGLRFRSHGTFEQTFPWKEIRSVRFPESTAPTETQDFPMQWTGEIGTLVAADSKMVVELVTASGEKWQVRHPVLGEIEVPLAWLQSWSPRIIGRRVEILPGAFHLGNKLVPEFSRPLADGVTLKLSFDYAAPGGTAAATLSVVGMEGIGVTAPFATRVRAGKMVTELWINDSKVEVLNKFLEDRPDKPVELRIPIPPGLLRPRKNVLEIRQLADPETGFHDESEVFQIAIEESSGPKD